MRTWRLRSAPCFQFSESAVATVSVIAYDDAGAGMGATRIASGTEDFVGLGGAAISGVAKGMTLSSLQEAFHATQIDAI